MSKEFLSKLQSFLNDHDELLSAYDAGVARNMITKWRRRLKTKNPQNPPSHNPLWDKMIALKEDPDKLRSLPYSDFLQTPYWHTIRSFMIEDSRGCCGLCAAQNVQFEVHHKTYEHHGWEHLYSQDLIVLCANCHAKHHDKIGDVS